MISHYKKFRGGLVPNLLIQGPISFHLSVLPSLAFPSLFLLMISRWLPQDWALVQILPPRGEEKEALQKPESFPLAPRRLIHTSNWPELGHSPLNRQLTRGWGHMFALDPSGLSMSCEARAGARTKI